MDFDGVHCLLIGNIIFGALIILGVTGYVLVYEVPKLYSRIRHAAAVRFAHVPEFVPVSTATAM